MGEFPNKKMNEFVNVTGVSTIVPPIKDNRPDWEEIKDVLNGEIPISKLGCN